MRTSWQEVLLTLWVLRQRQRVQAAGRDVGCAVRCVWRLALCCSAHIDQHVRSGRAFARTVGEWRLSLASPSVAEVPPAVAAAYLHATIPLAFRCQRVVRGWARE